MEHSQKLTNIIFTYCYVVVNIVSENTNTYTKLQLQLQNAVIKTYFIFQFDP